MSTHHETLSLSLSLSLTETQTHTSTKAKVDLVLFVGSDRNIHLSQNLCPIVLANVTHALIEEEIFFTTD